MKSQSRGSSLVPISLLMPYGGPLGTTSVQQVFINVLYSPRALDTGRNKTDFGALIFHGA